MDDRFGCSSGVGRIPSQVDDLLVRDEICEAVGQEDSIRVVVA